MHGLVVPGCPLTNPEANILATVYVSPPFSPLGQWKDSDLEHISGRCDSVMDLHDPSLHNHARNPYTSAQEQQQQQHGAGPTTDQFTAPASLHRFRQATTLEEMPDAMSSTARAENDPHLYSFAHGAQFGLVSASDAQTMHYATKLETPETQRVTNSIQYTPYNVTSVYGMSQTSSQRQSSQSQYDQTRYRMSAPSETISHQLDMPQPNQYYIASQADPSTASTSDLKYTQTSPHYHRTPAYGEAGPSTLQTQISSMLDPATPGAFAGYTQEATEQAEEPTVDPQAILNRCHTLVRSVFSHVYSLSLHDVGHVLLELSQRLLNNVETLGLTVDDESQHNERVELWNLHNHAWLSTLQAQFDMTQEMIHTQQPRSVIPLQELERLGGGLVRLCDDLERHGLVDYQMGVAEDEIMDRKWTALLALSLTYHLADHNTDGSIAEMFGIA